MIDGGVSGQNKVGNSCSKFYLITTNTDAE